MRKYLFVPTTLNTRTSLFILLSASTFFRRSLALAPGELREEVCFMAGERGGWERGPRIVVVEARGRFDGPEEGVGLVLWGAWKR